MSEPSSEVPSDPGIIVYWRPGCGFCALLLRRFDRHDIPHRRVNIWEDADAAATVRSIAAGNETVPTVVIGPVGLVNPGIDEVLMAASEHAPQAVPEGWAPPEPGRLGAWMSRKLGGS